MPYSGDPSTSQADEIRFLISDTSATPLLSDGEIAYWITRAQATYTDSLMIGAFCCEVIAGKYASEVSINADGVSISGDQLQAKYQALAAQLRANYKLLNGVNAPPSAGGIDRFEIPDLTVRPTSFGKGMGDNHDAGRQEYGYRGEYYHSSLGWPDGGGYGYGDGDD